MKRCKFSSRASKRIIMISLKKDLRKVLNDPKYKDMCVSREFHVINRHMIIYSQEKKGLRG